MPRDSLNWLFLCLYLLRLFSPNPDDDNDNDDEKPISLVVDASCLTVSKKGDYIEEKWIRKKKEFIKLHMAADAKSKKVISFRITRGNVHDAKKFCPLVRESSKKYNIDKVYADKAHDNRRNFNLLDRKAHDYTNVL
jgi:Transposase DDE domain